MDIKPNKMKINVLSKLRKRHQIVTLNVSNIQIRGHYTLASNDPFGEFFFRQVAKNKKELIPLQREAILKDLPKEKALKKQVPLLKIVIAAIIVSVVFYIWLMFN